MREVAPVIDSARLFFCRKNFDDDDNVFLAESGERDLEEEVILSQLLLLI